MTGGMSDRIPGVEFLDYEPGGPKYLSPSQKRRARLAALRAAETAFFESVKAEALPCLHATLQASPGRLDVRHMWNPFTRVGLIERKGDAVSFTDTAGIYHPPSAFDFIWLDIAAYRPFGDDPATLFRYVGDDADNNAVFVISPLPKEERYNIIVEAPPTGEPGVVWFREEGMPRSRWGDTGPWITTMQEARNLPVNAEGFQDGRIENVPVPTNPDGTPNAVDALVYPAALRWLAAHPEVRPLTREELPMPVSR